MKKIIILLLVLFLSISLLGCDNFTKQDIAETIASITNEGENEDIFEVKCKGYKNENYLNDYNSYRDENYYYYFFKLGRLYNVLLQEGESLNWQQAMESAVLEYRTSSTTESEIKRTSETSTTNSTKQSGHVEASATFTSKATAGIGAFSASASLSLGLSGGWSGEWAKATTSTNSFSNAKKDAESTSSAKSYTLNKKSKAGVYMYGFFGNIDVYAIVVYDFKNDEYSIDHTSTIVSTNKQVVYLGTEYTYKNYDENAFEFENNENIDTILQTIKKEPTSFYNGTGENAPNINRILEKKEILLFSKTLLDGEKKLNGSGASWTGDIKFAKTINELKTEGFETIHISINYELKEIDDCYQYVKLYNSSVAYYDEKFSVGGFKKYSYWSFGWHRYGTTDWKNYEIDLDVIIDNINEDSLKFKVSAENARYRDFYLKNVKAIVTAVKTVEVAV